VRVLGAGGKHVVRQHRDRVRRCIENFDAAFAYNAGHGATSIKVLGSDALLMTDEGSVKVIAKSADGVGLNIGLAFDPTETTAEQAATMVQALAQQVLGRV
jgi:hypothetical protein